MKLYRALILAAAPILAATAAHAETDSREVQQSIYDVVRGQQNSALREGRASLEQYRQSENRDSGYVRQQDLQDR